MNIIAEFLDLKYYYRIFECYLGDHAVNVSSEEYYSWK